MSSERYNIINDGRIYPPCSNVEAVKACKAVVREFGKLADAAASRIMRMRVPTWDGKLYRRCWVSSKPTTGTDKGWGRLIHDISHRVHTYRHPGHRPHEPGHERIEAEIRDFVVAQGFLEGKLKPVKVKLTTGERRAEKLSQIIRRIERWTAKERRAQNALKKLRRRRRILELQTIRTQSTEAAHVNQ